LQFFDEIKIPYDYYAYAYDYIQKYKIDVAEAIAESNLEYL